MSRENILKHLRAPEGVDEEKWRREFYFYVETSTSWLYWSLEYEDLEASDIQQSVENLCDRCEELERENARLREKNDWPELDETPFEHPAYARAREKYRTSAHASAPQPKE